MGTRLVAVLALVVGGSVAAQKPGPAGAPSLSRSVHSISSTVRPAESALVGTIEKVEQAERRLILRTHDGRVTFILAATAILRMGSKTLSLADLGSHSGRRAKVRYTTADGRRTAHWVVVSSEPPKTIQETLPR
jgi:hypothetical protein